MCLIPRLPRPARRCLPVSHSPSTQLRQSHSPSARTRTNLDVLSRAVSFPVRIPPVFRLNPCREQSRGLIPRPLRPARVLVHAVDCAVSLPVYSARNESHSPIWLDCDVRFCLSFCSNGSDRQLCLTPGSSGLGLTPRLPGPRESPSVPYSSSQSPSAPYRRSTSHSRPHTDDALSLPVRSERATPTAQLERSLSPWPFWVSHSIPVYN